MKKCISIVLILAVCLSMFMISSFADSGGELSGAGFYDEQTAVGEHISITGYFKGSDDVTKPIVSSTEKLNLDKGNPDKESKIYKGSEKFTVDVANSVVGKQYLILLVTGNSLPSKSSEICYIDQKEGNGDTISFMVYPNLDSVNGPMRLYVTSNDTEFGENYIDLNYYVPYMLGDVDGDGEISVTDAVKILEYKAHICDLSPKALKAADVDGDEEVSVTDAVRILELKAHIIEHF